MEKFFFQKLRVMESTAPSPSRAKDSVLEGYSMGVFLYSKFEFRLKHLSYLQVTTDKVLGGYCNRRLAEKL